VSVPRLVIFTGTKAQFIKLVPVVLEIERRGWDYRVIDTGQHASLVAGVIGQYGLRAPDLCLATDPRGVATVGQGLRWMARVLRHLAKPSARLREELFQGERAICLVHGDTVSTLLATLIARRAGQRVAHVEAGLRSHRFLHPFPEEIVRVIVMRLADTLFAPNPAALENLVNMQLKGRAVLLPDNTNLEALALTLADENVRLPRLPAPFGLATVHRLETIYRRKALSLVVDFVLEAHGRVPMVWIEHPPTAKRLAATGLERRLVDAGVTRLPLQPHGVFARLLRTAAFVLTDGGSIQEESYYLGTPCLLLRKTTERTEGLGENVVLSRMQPESLTRFLKDYEALHGPGRLSGERRPSAVILDALAAPADGVTGV
jgi:UDP-N-acetylglucosamine 2-epimerase